MGDLIRFPQERCKFPHENLLPAAPVTVLPVVRVERPPEQRRLTREQLRMIAARYGFDENGEPLTPKGVA